MKLLFYRYGSICEPDMIEEFKRLGIEVKTIDIEVTDKKASLEKRVDIITETLKKDTFLFVFSVNFYPFVSDICKIFNIPYVSWVVDSPVYELFSKQITNENNRVFCFDRKQSEYIKPYNPDNIFHLPLATNVERWDRVISDISAADRKKFNADISFVGSLYTEKDPYLEIKNPSPYLRGYVDGLSKSQSLVQGFNLIEKSLTKALTDEIKALKPNSFYPRELMVCDTDSYVAAHGILDMHCSSLERIEILTALSQYYDTKLYTLSDTSVFKDCPKLEFMGPAATLTEMPKVFNLSKINLNMTIHAIETGASLRIWDIMGCGGFLMSNYQEELLEYLEPGVDFDYYTTLDELIDKCGFYLENEDVRKKIALNGYEKTKAYHTYSNRMPQMFKSIMKE